MMDSLIEKCKDDSGTELSGYRNLIVAEIISMFSKSMRLYDNAIAKSVKIKVSQLLLLIRTIMAISLASFLLESN